MASWAGRVIKFSIIVFTVLLVSSSLLAIMARMGYSPATPYSVTSKSDNGLSKFREIVEGQGYKTELIVTDPESAINIGSRIVYVIVGPALKYDEQSALTLLSLLGNGSSILIVDDFGRANSLLYWIWTMFPSGEIARALLGGEIDSGATIESFMLYFNTSAVVMDAGSYWSNPAYVVIRNFNDYSNVLSSDVQAVLTKFAASLSIDMTIKYADGTKKRYIVPLPSEVGFMLTTPFSWLETDIDSIMDGEATPDNNEWGGISFSIGITFEVPNGGRVAIIGDPDIFTNEVLDIAATEGFDNREFIIDLIDWLSFSSKSRIIVFDESRKSFTPDNPLFGLALTMKVVTSFTRYWIIAPLIPIIFILFFIYYLPRRFKRELRIFKPTTKKVGTSPYYGRYLWYMYRGGYREAFKVIMDNLRRSIKFRLGIPQEKWEDILEALTKRRPDLSRDVERLKIIVELWFDIIRGKKVKVSPDEYLEIFDFIRKFQSKL